MFLSVVVPLSGTGGSGSECMRYMHAMASCGHTETEREVDVPFHGFSFSYMVTESGIIQIPKHHWVHL